MTAPDYIDSHEPSPIRLRGPDDIRDSIPHLLGFVPSDSLVFLGLDDTANLLVTARADAPTSATAAAGVAETVGQALVLSGSVAVLIVVIAPTNCDAIELGRRRSTLRRHVRLIERSLAADDIEIVGWLWDGEPRRRPAQIPQIAMTTIVSGRRTYLSRADLATQVAAQPGAIMERTAGLIDDLAPIGIPDRELASALDGLFERRVAISSDGRSRPPLGPHEIAVVCLALDREHVRGALLRMFATDPTPVVHEILCEVVRYAPAGAIAASATMLAIASYLGGDGVLSRCALERARADDPSFALAQLVEGILDHGMPPLSFGKILQEATEMPP